MKKSLVVGAAVLAFAALAPRSLAADISLGWGFKGGLSVGTISAQGALPTSWSGGESVTGLVFGVYCALNLNERLAIQPEIFYLTHGGGGEFPDSSDPEVMAKTIFDFAYLHVPVLAKIRLMQGVRAVPVVFAGPAVGYLLSAKGRYYLDDGLDHEDEITRAFKRWNLGLLFGGGVDWKLSRLSLIIDIRFDLGLTNISRPHPGTPFIKTRTFSFLVGVGF